MSCRSGKARLAFFVSGGGSDMQSVLDVIDSGRLDAEAVYVVSTRDGVYALERARRHGIRCGVFPLAAYDTLEARDASIMSELDGAGGVDLIILAGYLGTVTASLIERYRGRIINIHPSLIPRHSGKGFYGMRVHEAVIAAGDKISGATVHFVDEGMDTGEIIMQRTLDVLSEDTPESLQKRVLELEHGLLPDAVKAVLGGIKGECK